MFWRGSYDRRVKIAKGLDPLVGRQKPTRTSSHALGFSQMQVREDEYSLGRPKKSPGVQGVEVDACEIELVDVHIVFLSRAVAVIQSEWHSPTFLFGPDFVETTLGQQRLCSVPQ